MKILVKNVTILTMDQEKRVFRNGYLLTEDSIIKEIGTMEMNEQSEKRIFHPVPFFISPGK